MLKRHKTPYIKILKCDETPRLGEYEKDSRYKVLLDDWTITYSYVQYGISYPRKVTVRKGFLTDGASIPWFAWHIVGKPFDPENIVAALPHDWLYNIFIFDNGKSISRHETDLLFYSILVYMGKKKSKAKLEYIGVRLFSWPIWYIRKLKKSWRTNLSLVAVNMHQHNWKNSNHSDVVTMIKIFNSD